MNILGRMYLRQALKVFFLTSGGMLVIFLLFEFFDLAQFTGNRELPPGPVLRYLLLTIPKYLLFTLPLGSLLSTLVVLGMAGRDRELVAIRALGGSLRRTAMVFVGLGAALSGASLFLSEAVAPPATREALRVRDAEIRGIAPKTAFSGEGVWIRSEKGTLIRIEAFSGTFLKGFSAFLFNGRLAERVEAASGQWDGSAWVLSGVRIRQFGDESIELKTLDRYPFPDLDPPQTLAKAERRPEEMSYIELRDYASRLARAGFRAEKYLVNLHGKLSYPFVCLDMAILGTAMALRQRKGGGMRATGYAVLVTAAYWAVHMLTLSMGYAGRLPPTIAAWTAPILFLAAGVFLYSRTETS